MIWGLTLEPGKIYTRVMGDEIQLSMASLESRADYGDEGDGYSHVLMKTTKSEYLLCTLVHGLTFQQNLDLKLRPKETVTFSVQGSNVVYLMGYSVTDSEVEDQIDIEEEEVLEEDRTSELVDFEGGNIEEGQTLRDDSIPDEEEVVAMVEEDLGSHPEDLESKDLNPPSTSRSEIHVEVNRSNEFATEELPSVSIKVEEPLEPDRGEDAEQDILPSTLVSRDTAIREPTGMVPTHIQRNRTMQGHNVNPQHMAGPTSVWTGPSFNTHLQDPPPVLPDVGSVSSAQTGDGEVASRALTHPAQKRLISERTNWSRPTTKRIRNQQSEDILPIRLLAEACSSGTGQVSQQGSTLMDKTKLYPVSCPLCRIEIRGTKQFQVHLRSHTGEKPFRCSSCPKSFSQRQNRDRHERTHTGARPFQCRFCERTFTQSHHRKKHEAHSHGELWTSGDL